MDSEGEVYTDVLNPLMIGGTSLIGSVGVNELLLISVYNDTMRSGTSRRGYALSAGDAPERNPPQVPTSVDARARIQFNSSTFSVYSPGNSKTCCDNVTFVIGFAQQLFFLIKTDSEKVTALQLLSSIIGLTGVLAFFAKILYYTDVFDNVVKPAVSARLLKRDRPVSSSAVEHHTGSSNESGGAQRRSSEGGGDAQRAEVSAEARVGVGAMAATGVVVGGALAVLSDSEGF
jgi:hypothetical protein